MRQRGESQDDWFADQLTETQRLITKLRDEPESPKRNLALEELARVQLRILQILSASDEPNPN